jgi:hypothetical protein
LVNPVTEYVVEVLADVAVTTVQSAPFVDFSMR